MENAVDALKIAFAVFIFVIALTISITVLSQARTVSEMVLYMSDKTNFYATLSEKELNEKYNNNGRIVGVETIIPTLYRYYKENYTVIIRNNKNEIIELFDLNMENIVYNASYSYTDKDGNTFKYTFGARTEPSGMSTTNIKVNKNGTKSNGSVQDLNIKNIYARINYSENNDEYKINSFKKDNKNLIDLYPYGAPWVGNTDNDTKTRVDAFVSGKEKTINGKKVVYKQKSGNGFYATYKGNKFLETYEEYRYSGTTENGMEIVKGNTKVIITYTQK